MVEELLRRNNKVGNMRERMRGFIKRMDSKVFSDGWVIYSYFVAVWPIRIHALEIYSSVSQNFSIPKYFGEP